MEIYFTKLLKEWKAFNGTLPMTEWTEETEQFIFEGENQFYPVCESDIKEVEGTLGLKFPFELSKFLLERWVTASFRVQNIM